MRIVLLTSIPFWHPGTSELINVLRREGLSIIAIDIFHGRMLDDDNKIVNLLPLGLNRLFARIYLKLFRNILIEKHIQNDDILDIHFVEPYYSKYILKLPNKIICTLFGSDLFRTNSEQKKMQKPLFERADKIVLSENMVPYFESYFGSMNSKYYYNQYGSERIDQIIKQKPTFSKPEAKLRFGIPQDKLIITCGYNNKEEQQHIAIIEQTSKLPKEVKDNLFLIFPMTYGDVSADYINEVKNLLIDSKFSFLIFEDRLSNQEIVEIRLISDITINTQTTDALASSIKEAFVAGDLVLVGDWLPYGIYEELGVKFEKINFENLTDVLRIHLDSFISSKNKYDENEYIIDDFASWNSLTVKWLNFYNTL